MSFAYRWLIIACALVFMWSEAHAQDAPDSPWRLEVGAGFFEPGGYQDAGTHLSINVGRELPSGFVASFGVGIGHVWTEYHHRNPMYGGDRNYDTVYLARLGFDYPFALARHSDLTLGIGVSYRRGYRVYADGIPVVTLDGEVIGVAEQEVVGIDQPDLGLSLASSYVYRWSTVGLGVRGDVYVLYDLGIQGYTVGPVFRVHF